MAGEIISKSNGVEIRQNQTQRLAELHIAEFNALTARITYYVTLQYATWGIGAGLFGYLAQLWLKPHLTAHDHQNLDWIGLVGVLAVSWAAQHITYEFLVIVLYLKEKLLQSMATAAGITLDEALGFESWLRQLGNREGESGNERWIYRWFKGRVRQLGGWEEIHRNKAPSVVFALGFVVLLVLLVIDTIQAHPHWSSSDTWWAIVSGSLLAIVSVKLWRISVLNNWLQDRQFENREA